VERFRPESNWGEFKEKEKERKKRTIPSWGEEGEKKLKKGKEHGFASVKGKGTSSE